MSTLETRIATAVGRVVTNVSNWPDAVAPHMLGRDLAEPIALIAAALAPVIAEEKAEAWEEGNIDGRSEENPYRRNGE